MLTVTAGPFSFKGKLETERAPRTVAAFERLLPFHSKIIHVRWSGESAWIPLGDLDIGLDRRPRTPPAIRLPARSSGTPAASARPSCCSPTAARCSPASSASSPVTTS